MSGRLARAWLLLPLVLLGCGDATPSATRTPSVSPTASVDKAAVDDLVRRAAGAIRVLYDLEDADRAEYVATLDLVTDDLESVVGDLRTRPPAGLPEDVIRSSVGPLEAFVSAMKAVRTCTQQSRSGDSCKALRDTMSARFGPARDVLVVTLEPYSVLTRSEIESLYTPKK